MQKGFIYKMVNPTGNIYIGQTKNIEDRLKRYKGLRCKSQKKLYNSLKKHGFESHEITILEEVDIGLIMEREIFWIDYFKTNCYKHPDIGGLNLCDGGIGPVGRVASEDSKIKNGNKHRGKTMSEESRRKISMSLMGRVQSLETRKKISEKLKGKPLTQETKEKLSMALKGRNEHCFKRKVNQIDIETNEIIAEFESITNAALSLGNKSYKGNISAVCRGRLCKMYGYKWKYK
jgi:group I intron endonuclease